MKPNKETVGQRLSKLVLEHAYLRLQFEAAEGLLMRIVEASNIHDKESKCYEACRRCAAMDAARKLLGTNQR